MAGHFRFNQFTLNPSAYQLSRGKRMVKIERLPMELLMLLVEHPGELVTREEIVRRLWGDGVFVDIENGINTAVRKLRQSLGDNPKRPRYIETVAAKGYRFIATVKAEDRTSSRPRVMLAVLPFVNLNQDPSQEYFADGLMEETIAVLGATQPEVMGVIARTSAMAYKNTNKSIAQIGRELSVDFVLESSVRRDGDRVRVTAQLIRVTDQIHLWAKSYERSSGGVLTLQNEIAQAIAEQVTLKLAKRQEPQLSGTNHPGAYEAYLRGRFYWNQRGRTAIYRAIEYFETAIVLDPDYSAAHAGLGNAYAVLPIGADMRTSECLPNAHRAAEAALRCDSRSAEAHSCLAACTFWMEWDWERAEAEARKAVELNPSSALARMLLAHILSNGGRHSEAQSEIALAKELDPLSSHMHAIQGQLLYQAGQYDEAVAAVQRALVFNPNSWIAWIIEGKLEIQAGRLDRALRALEKSFELADGNTEPLSLQAFCYARLGDHEQVRRVLGVLTELARCRYVPPYNIAMIYAGLEQAREAITWLGRAHAERDVRMVFLPVDPKWAALNQLPEVRKLWPGGKQAQAFC